MINIGGDPLDIFYRYKRPKIISKFEGYKTRIINLNEVASSLNTKPDYIMQYFSYEKGCIVKDNYINGNHVLNLEGMLEEYIKKWILCKQCHLPELTYLLNKKCNVTCKSCGYSQTIANCKFVNYMIKKN